ncbi:hypothetical protein NMK50_07535 [Bartonella harrusi]|uniref:Secreted protein n=1 Tax=Bartonella harrusi TaxID=2961895 RepID=A0ABY5ESI5_9HYPH|nr:hypothetical protein [Bartonella harrusi]UTO28050.1 hypothetical protein NMK50_07535 [Bartonella harrusi]
MGVGCAVSRCRSSGLSGISSTGSGFAGTGCAASCCASIGFAGIFGTDTELPDTDCGGIEGGIEFSPVTGEVEERETPWRLLDFPPPVVVSFSESLGTGGYGVPLPIEFVSVLGVSVLIRAN